MRPARQSRLARIGKELNRSKHYYLLMSPYMIIFFLFTVIPVVLSLGLSFFYFNMLEFPRFVGWQNYSRLFLNDDIFMIALKNTLMFAVITGPISYFACFVFAWIINELSPKVRAFMTLIFYAPSISGNVFFIWLIVFSGDSYGYLNGFLMKSGFILEPIQWLLDEKYILPIVMIVQLWLSLGTSFLAFIAGLQTIDKTLIEAGAVDGIKNRWQELWYITLPSMRPQLMFGAVMQITASFAVADISIALAGFPSVNYAAHTVVTHLMDFGTIRFEMGYASAIATVLFFLMIGSNKLTQKLLRKVGE
ncbi:carbohydrate ABC transporter permease [Paenibacillus nanensis]|uniref:carbohydrate ABC transporter permease n=1 Tax=Paenibacillus nanensis TaxID=393251 RepID=UPI00197F4758|nr:sugar ABC transporter permease [Paenibacillus nanensis]